MREFMLDLETPLDGTLFTPLATTAAMRPAERLTKRVTNHNSSGMSGEPSCTGVNPM